MSERVRFYDGKVWMEMDKFTRNTKTGVLRGEGNVFYENLEDGQRLSCDIAEYDLNTETGTFYNVKGSAKATIQAKPGMLTTSDPFYFEGEKAEKVKNRYIVHNGFITDCKPTNLWWRLRGKTFDVVPNNRAIAHHSTLYIKKVPIFYFPKFYKSLKEQPRRSGFLLPTFGNSSQRGQFIGSGFFWAINRSYNAAYRSIYFTRRGFVHEGDFSGWINQRTYFEATMFGAPDYNGRGCTTHPVTRVVTCTDAQPRVGGYVLTGNARTYLGTWEGRLDVRELSSLPFRQEFTQNFDEAIASETHTVGYLAKHWGDYGFNVNGQRNVNYQSIQEGDQILIRKLPEAQFVVREHALGKLPIWISLDSSAGLNNRTQPSCQLSPLVPKCPNAEFETWQFSPRMDFAPRVTTAAHWLGLDLSPSFGIRETYYGQRFLNGQAFSENLVRSSQDFQFDLGLPRISRIMAAPKWMRAGDKVKHAIDARVRYRYVNGINEFQNTLRFDQVDVISNTNEIEFSLTNRLLRRNPFGGGDDVIIWQVLYKRYLDPTFGGAVVPNRRNVVESSDLLTGYAFLYGPRDQSPIVSILRVQSRVGLEWRTDYDPDPSLQKFVNSTFSMDYRSGQYFFVASYNLLDTNPVLAPKASQIRGQFLYGGDNHRGWNYGLATGYDFLLYKNRPRNTAVCNVTPGACSWTAGLQYISAQATYNTDCCGFSVQYRKNNFTTINDNQFRFAFTIANIGSFGTLGRQQRVF